MGYYFFATDNKFTKITIGSDYGDGLFTLTPIDTDGTELNHSYLVHSGRLFDLTTIIEDGIPAFKLTGIEESAGVLVGDPIGFLVRLGFAATEGGSFIMKPIPAIPEPKVFALVSIGLMFVFLAAYRRNSAHERGQVLH